MTSYAYPINNTKSFTYEGACQGHITYVRNGKLATAKHFLNLDHGGKDGIAVIKDVIVSELQQELDIDTCPLQLLQPVNILHWGLGNYHACCESGQVSHLNSNDRSFAVRLNGLTQSPGLSGALVYNPLSRQAIGIVMSSEKSHMINTEWGRILWCEAFNPEDFLTES